MKITIIYDNEIYTKGIGLKSDWGFSCLIKTQNDNILFDTGTRGRILLNNMKKLKINPKNIEKIVISHEHRDHRGGLKSLIPYVKDIKLYHLGDKNPNKKMISTIPDIPEKITENVWTTGRIKGLVDEQSLVLKGDKGWYVLTGCSHPGVEKIMQTAKQIGEIVGIIGGFHGFNNLQILENLDFVCPCHCTAHKKDIKRAFPDKISDCGVGRITDI